MDIQKLTKKNQEFIHIATNQLIKDGKSDQEIKDILGNVIPELIENQKKGITGRGLLGAPTVWAASFSLLKNTINLKLVSLTRSAETDKTPWKMWFFDASLFLLAIVAIAERNLWFSGTQTSCGLWPLSFSVIHWSLAMYTFITTTSTVTITNQKKNVKMVVQHDRHHTLFYCMVYLFSL